MNEQMISHITDIEKDIFAIRSRYLAWSLRCNPDSPAGKRRAENAKHAMDALMEAREIIVEKFKHIINSIRFLSSRAPSSANDQRLRLRHRLSAWRIPTHRLITA